MMIEKIAERLTGFLKGLDMLCNKDGGYRCHCKFDIDVKAVNSSDVDITRLSVVLKCSADHKEPRPIYVTMICFDGSVLSFAERKAYIDKICAEFVYGVLMLYIDGGLASRIEGKVDEYGDPVDKDAELREKLFKDSAIRPDKEYLREECHYVCDDPSEGNFESTSTEMLDNAKICGKPCDKEKLDSNLRKRGLRAESGIYEDSDFGIGKE